MGQRVDQPEKESNADPGLTDDATFLLRLRPDAVARVLFAIIAMLAVLNLVATAIVRWGGWERLDSGSDIIQLVDLDYERSIGTWYQGIILALCGVILLVIGVEHRQRRRRPRGAGWLLLGTIFLALSFDELVSIHEQSMVPVRDWLGIEGGIFYFAWVIPAAVLLVLLAGLMIPLLRDLPSRTRTRFLAAGGIYVGGAMGMELLGAAYISGGGSGDSLTWTLMTTLEEVLEKVGIALFLRALLLYIGRDNASILMTAHPVRPPRVGTSNHAFGRE